MNRKKKCANVKLFMEKAFQKVFPMHRKKFSMLFLFNFVPQQSLNFSFYVSFCEINCIKIQAMSQSSSKSILAEILCVLFTLTSSFASD